MHTIFGYVISGKDVVKDIENVKQMEEVVVINL